MKKQIAIIGTGFWSDFQVAAWKELPGVEIVAAYNRTRDKAEKLCRKYGIPKVFDNADEMLSTLQLDAVDIITDVKTHQSFTVLAASKGVDVICQKPLSTSMPQAEEMVRTCEKHGVKLYVHENFRWQSPMRELKALLENGVIGNVFKARVSFCSAFPVFDNQPFLAEEPQFILTDIGSHILDVCRFLFGEAASLYCRTATVNKKIKGEDVANVLLEMQNGIHCYAEMSYASLLESESFPQTLVLVEGESGSVCLNRDYQIRVTTKKGTTASIASPRKYAWADPDYMLVHSSIVDCNRNILEGLQGGKCETDGYDNLQTAALVWSCYESAKHNKVIFF